MRVHGAWSEFLNKFPDLTNMTFEETDGGLDRSHESLGAAFKMRQDGETHTVDDCAMYRDDSNGLQRHEQRIFLWTAGAQDEDPWEFSIALRKRSCSTFCPRCSCLFARVELSANDPQE